MSNTEPQPFIVTCTSDKKHEINAFGLVEKLNLEPGEHPKQRISELSPGDVIKLGTNIIQIKEMQKPFSGVPFSKLQSGPIAKVKESDDESIAFNLSGEDEEEIEKKVEEKIEEVKPQEEENIELVDDSQ